MRAANQKGSKSKSARCDSKDSATDGAGTRQLRLGGFCTLLLSRGSSCLGFCGTAGRARLIALRRGGLSRKRAAQRHRSQAQVAGKGYAPKFDKQSSLGTDATMNAGIATSTIAGSFTVSSYLGADAQKKFAYAPLPIGPVGRRSAMNGLHDVVWSGSKHPDEAFKWIAYMASDKCQIKVGESGVIFPASIKGTEASLKAREAKGQDNSAFTTVVENKETFSVPVFSHGDEVNALIQDAIQEVAGGADPQATMTAANEKANALLK